MGFPDNNDFSKTHFPPIADPANEETKVDELYPERLQDEVNEIYKKDKVLPRQEGVDFTKDKEMYEEGAESVSTFPYKY